MNALRLDPSEPTFAHLFETRREPLFTRKSVLAAGVVLLCYAGIGFYFTTIKGAAVPLDPPIEDGPIIIQPWREPTPKTAVKPDTPTVRNPVTTPTTPPPTTLPFTPSDNPATATMPTEFSTEAEPAAVAAPGEVGPPAATAAPPAPPPVIRNPVWISRPTASQVERLYPDRALDRGVAGRAVLVCTVRLNGSMGACDVVSETPGGYRFGEAALAMARYFRISPKTVDGQMVEGSQVQIPINFSLPD